MAAKQQPRNDPDRADEAPAPKLKSRIKGAYFLGGAWYAADHTPLTNVETQAAHRAAEKAVRDVQK